jgi:hypothetical protein
MFHFTNSVISVPSVVFSLGVFGEVYAMFFLLLFRRHRGTEAQRK